MSIGRDIPEPSKRLLRQEAAFGCCVCGNPFLTYHHIVPFALAQKHDPANMMVLCPNHHSQADEGALTESEQRRWKATSYNVVRRYVDGQLFTNEDLLAVETRRHLFIGAFRFIVDGEAIFQVEQADSRRILLTLRLYEGPSALPGNLNEDEEEGEPKGLITIGETPRRPPIYPEEQLAFSIERNEWTTGDPTPWDIEVGFRWVRLRLKRGDAKLFIDARRYPIQLRTSLWRKGYNLAFADDFVLSGATGGRISLEESAIVGAQIVVNSNTGGIVVEAAPGFPRAGIVGGATPKERFSRGLEMYHELLRGRLAD